MRYPLTSMTLDETHKRLLLAASEQLLRALSTIAGRARAKLAEAPTGSPAQVLAGAPNPMVEGNRTTRHLGTMLGQDRAHLERITREPFAARLVVEWDDTPDVLETLYVTRASAAGLTDATPDGRLVTYTAALGRLAEFPAGETTTVTTGGRVRQARVHERVQLRPEHRDDEWDALDNRLEFSQWHAVLESLRAALVQLIPGEEVRDLVSALRQEALDEELARSNLRRKVIDRISLRDQPILNQYQGEIFRMPLGRQVLLLGPPGTGKTTTLIRRLAQKRTPEALTDDEKESLSVSGLQQAHSAPESWAMFSPTELLSLYLRDAFNQEGVAAIDRVNLRTWDRERLDLARNVLGILRSANSGVFVLDDAIEALADSSSAGLSAVFDTFAGFVERTVTADASDALRYLESAQDAALVEALRHLRRVIGDRDPLTVREIVRLIDAADLLQAEMRRLDDLIRADVDRTANRLLTAHSGLLAELSQILPSLVLPAGLLPSGDDEDEEYVEDDGDALPISRDDRIRALAALLSAIRTLARATALGRSRVGGNAARVLELLGERRPAPAELAALGNLLVTRGRLRALQQAPRRFVMGVPRLYAAFRREAVPEGRLYQGITSEVIRQNRISPDEADIVILAMLRNARTLATERLGASPDWLDAIRSRYLTQVYVDEATDFSSVQLACTMALTHPRLRSWFACGDLLQRVTAHGMQDVSELGWIVDDASTIDIREVRIGYRQARRLRELGIALAGAQGTGIEGPDHDEDTVIWPLLAENQRGHHLGEWLAQRILEVERAVGHLPSIAVLVDGEDRVDELVALTRPSLDSMNIPIVACKDGRVVGDAQEVRVFDVRHIKGLEFEAVFFVGIDRLAQRLPALFDRYLYVGITRAATYLGVTCDGPLPTPLERVRMLFGDAASHPW